ncbi:hypothetical protein MIDIC_460006 [Alphaproteobacteria bacterium]
MTEPESTVQQLECLKGGDSTENVMYMWGKMCLLVIYHSFLLGFHISWTTHLSVQRKLI